MTESIDEAIIRGNKFMDSFIDGERKSLKSWSGRDKMPEPITELLDVYVSLTGQKPTKRDLLDWLQTGNDWLDLGAVQEDVKEAYKIACPDNGKGFLVVRPGSLTRVIGMIIGKRRAKPERSYTGGEYADFIEH